jgi:hypothetical protein
MVSESLRNLLLGEMELTSEVPVTVLAPDEGGGDRRINLFLYKVQESPFLKNMDWQVKRGEPTQLVPPPLSLNLFYLMTPYAPNDVLAGNAASHAILGEAMRVFYENSIVPEDYLVDGLKGAREQVKIIHNTLDLEELSQVWSTFTQPFRLSVMYEVSVVQLDMLSSSERAMATRVRGIGKPDVSAPFNPPVVEDIEPKSGPAGTVINFRGKNLSGWRAYVTIMGRVILGGEELTGDSFDITVPAELSPGQATPPGFHEIRVDISHLFRKTFFFEVTT